MKKVKRYQIFSLICGLYLLMGCLSNAITVKAQEAEVVTDEVTEVVTEDITQTVSGNDAAVISEEETTDEYTYTDGNQNVFTYVLDTEGNAIITSITATGSAITVPAVIDNKTVISVGNNNECVITNPSTVIPELTINCPSIGVKAFANLTIGTLTIGEEVTNFESIVEIGIKHGWKQFMESKIDKVIFNARELVIEKPQASTIFPTITGPFYDATIGDLEIGSEVTIIPEMLFWYANMELEELHLNVPRIGAFAFSGYDISIGTLTLGEQVTTFEESCYGTTIDHYWEQFCYSTIGALRLESNVLELGHYAGVGNSLCIYGPFNQSNIGSLQIADNVTRIPEAFLNDAKLTMDEPVVDFESVGAFAFSGANISIENLKIVSTDCVFEESYYSTNINHYFNQFAYTNIGSLTLETPSLTMEHVKEKSTTNWVHAPFSNAAVENFSIGAEVEAIPEYFLYEASLTMDELTLNVSSVGAYAFGGGDISIDTLIVTDNVTAFPKSFYSTDINHFWGQFEECSIGHLIYEAPDMEVAGDEEMATITNIYPPFRLAVIDQFTLADAVTNIPHYLLYNASLTMDELVLDMDSVGSFAFAGENIHIGKLYIKDGLNVFEKAPHSTIAYHRWQQFSEATVGEVYFEVANTTLDKVTDEAYCYGPFSGCNVGKLVLGDAVETIPPFCFSGIVLNQSELALHVKDVGCGAFQSSKLELGTLTIGEEVESFSSMKVGVLYYFYQFSAAKIGQVNWLPANLTTGDECYRGAFYNTTISNIVFGDKVQVIPNYLLFEAIMDVGEYEINVPTIGCFAFKSSGIRFDSLTIGENVTSFLTDKDGYSNAFSKNVITKVYYNAVNAQMNQPYAGIFGPFDDAVITDFHVGEQVEFLHASFLYGSYFTNCYVYPVKASDTFNSQTLETYKLPETVNLYVHYNSDMKPYFAEEAENITWMCLDYLEESYGDVVYDEETGTYKLEVLKHCTVCGYEILELEEADISYDIYLSIPLNLDLAFDAESQSFVGSAEVYVYGSLGNAYEGVKLLVDETDEAYGMAVMGEESFDMSSYVSAEFMSGNEALFTIAQLAGNANLINTGTTEGLYTDTLSISVPGIAFLQSGAGSYSIQIPVKVELY